MPLIAPFDPWKNTYCTCPNKFSLSPYTGCTHACLYCYASSYIINFSNPRPKKNFLERLKSQIKDIISSRAGDYGIFVEDLDTGASFGASKDKKFTAASLGKLLTLVSLYKKIEDGQINPSQTLTVEESDFVDDGESLSVGTSQTIKELAWLLCKKSDDTAWNLLNKTIGWDYLRAMKVRTIIINDFKKAFKKIDVLAAPTMPILPPRTAARVPKAPLAILTKGCWRGKLDPDTSTWNLRHIAFGSVAPNSSFMVLAHILLAALSFAISSKKSLFAPRTGLNLLPMVSISRPLLSISRINSLRMAMVNAISCMAFPPASCMS